jgi:hypothetical protein
LHAAAVVAAAQRLTDALKRAAAQPGR